MKTNHTKDEQPTFKLGDKVRKKSGSNWYGTVVGLYSTLQTPEGYAVESGAHKNTVQIYPVQALELDEKDEHMTPDKVEEKRALLVDILDLFGNSDRDIVVKGAILEIADRHGVPTNEK